MDSPQTIKNPQADLAERWTPGILILMVVAFWGPLLIRNQVPLLGDLCYLFYPGYVYLREFVLQGHLPLWNPYAACGEPFLADVQRGVFYPVNLVYLILPTGRAIVVCSALHFLIAGMGTYGLLRVWRVSRAGALLAAVSYAFNTYTVTKVEFPSQLGGTAFCPVVLAAYALWLQRRDLRTLLLTAVAIGLQFLAGHPEMVFFTSIALVIYALTAGYYDWRRRNRFRYLVTPLAAVVGAGLWALVLAMAQFLPTTEALLSSTRSEASNPCLEVSSVHPSSLATLFVPSIQGVGGWGGVCWAPSVMAPSIGGYYVGVVPMVVLLAVTVRKIMTWRLPKPDPTTTPPEQAPLCAFLVILFAFFFLYAMGWYTPFYSFWRAVIPLVRHFLWPAKCLVCVTLALSCMTGLGLDRLTRDARLLTDAGKWWQRLLLRRGVELIFLLVAVVVVILIIRLNDLFIPLLRKVFNLSLILDDRVNRVPDISWNSLFRDSIKLPMVGMLAAFLLTAYAIREKSRYRVALILAILSFVDLTISNHYLLQAGPAKALETPSALADQLRLPHELVRMYSIEHVVQGPMAESMGTLLDGQPNDVLPISRPESIEQSVPGRSIYSLRQLVYGSFPMVEKVFNVFSIRNFVSKEISRLAILPIGMNTTKSLRLRLLALLNCDRFVFMPELPFTMTLGKIQRQAILVRFPNPMPRAFVVGGVQFCDDERGVLGGLFSEAFDPWCSALTDAKSVKRNSFPDLMPRKVDHKVLSYQYRPNGLEIQVQSDIAGLLVVSETYDRGWRARVNGQEAPVYKVDYALRGLRVPAGRSTVVMTYAPRTLNLGIALSLSAVVLTVVLIVLKRKNQPMMNSDPDAS